MANSPAGAEVGYTATVLDDTDSNPTLNCAPVSGSVFPIGTSTITCTASDAAGNNSAAGFHVIVLEQFTLTIKLDPAAKLDLRDHTVTLSGSVACNRDGQVFVSGELRQPRPPGGTLGYYGAVVDCTQGKGNWTATSVALEGGFQPGPARAAVTSDACDSYGSCANGQASRSILLLPL